MSIRQSITAGCITAAAVSFAPLCPFFALIIFPLSAVICGFPVLGLLLAVLLDAFLLPSGAPVWVSLSLYTALSVPLYLYIRHNISV